MTLTWPVPGYGISVVDGEVQGSDAHVARGGGFAIDIAAPHGTPVLAVHTATVEQASWLGDDTGYGVVYSWVTGDGVFRCLMCHFAERPLLSTLVMTGEQVGFVGATGHATGPHVHLWLERNGYRVRPEEYLQNEPPVEITPDIDEPLLQEVNMRTPEQERLIGWLAGWGAELNGLAVVLEKRISVAETQVSLDRKRVARLRALAGEHITESERLARDEWPAEVD